MIYQMPPSSDNRSEQEKICNSIKKYLKQNKISYKELAPRLNIPLSTLGYYLSGRHPIPERIVDELCDMFGFDRYYLLFGSQEVSVNDNGGRIIIHHSLFTNSADQIPQVVPPNVDVPVELENMRRRLGEISRNVVLLGRQLEHTQYLLAEAMNQFDATIINPAACPETIKNYNSKL